MTMKKDIRTLAALLIASATFVACSSDDNIANENQQPANGKYTLTINASKSDRANTRALDLSGKTLTASWATTENVYVQKSGTWAGSLQPQENGPEATLKGTLTNITIEPNDKLYLQFPRSGARDYTGQVGTLADIAAKYDYATATVEVEGVSGTGNIIPKSETTAFASQQAIVKFTLLGKANGTTPLNALNATELVVNDGTTDYTIKPTSETSEIYVAIPGFSDKTVTLTATVGSDIYTYTTASAKTFTNGKYYEITVKMGKVIEVFKSDDPKIDDFVAPSPSLNYLHIGLDQAYAIAKQLSTQNGDATVAVVYNHNGPTAKYALSSDASAKENTGPSFYLKNNYRVFLATLWESAQ